MYVPPLVCRHVCPLPFPACHASTCHLARHTVRHTARQTARNTAHNTARHTAHHTARHTARHIARHPARHFACHSPPCHSTRPLPTCCLWLQIRCTVEACESLQSFLMLHSLGGGTGSGVGTYILELLADEYPDVFRFTASVFPSEVSCVSLRRFSIGGWVPLNCERLPAEVGCLGARWRRVLRCACAWVDR
eukprot:359474-Chlamydomonas_euryale.AAC.3